MSQSLETDANLAISPKKIIRNILFSIPVIYENKFYVNHHCHFFPSSGETVMHGYDTSAVLPKPVFFQFRRQPGPPFQDSTIFLCFFLCPFSYSNFWLDRKFQASAQTQTDIIFTQNSFKFPHRFCFNILIFLPIYSCPVVHTINKIHELEFLWFGRNVSQHQTGWLLLFIISQLQQFTHEDNTRIVFMLSSFIR
jgi:hypothetical protein